MDKEIVINFSKYEELLMNEYNNSSPKVSEKFISTYGLKYIGTEFDELDSNNTTLKFEIVDIHKWTLAKIKYGI